MTQSQLVYTLTLHSPWFELVKSGKKSKRH